MIEREYGKIIPICDSCGKRLGEYDGDDFKGATEGMRFAGWMSRKFYGEWMHFCDECGLPKGENL